jgi:UDP-glucose 4-epimerase|tara:strand:+ start:4066 stop:4923 length:858 start_codon:yes stop_codon:yes gene_type:complete
MKKIVITGGAGFIGTNLIHYLIDNNIVSADNIIVIDNGFTGEKRNMINKVNYIQGNTWDINEILYEERYIDTIFHFGEYSRISTSFDDIDYVMKTNLYGTSKVIEYCNKYDVKLIYSASSSKFGDKENLSPYAWSKSKAVELIKNYNKWYGLSYEICYFFNVYGKYQITTGSYATVIGIFENQMLKRETLTVVKPGVQSRCFTHVDDVINGVVKAVYHNSNHEWYFQNHKSYNIMQVADMFNSEWRFVEERQGERFSSPTIKNDTKELLNWEAKIELIDYINTVK